MDGGRPKSPMPVTVLVWSQATTSKSFKCPLDLTTRHDPRNIRLDGDTLFHVLT
jgi:hypothetical protein